MRIGESAFVLGESQEVLKQYDPDQVHLCITSPPYFNQREEYASYENVEQYLQQMAEIYTEVFRILRPGQIFACNIGQDRSIDLPAYTSGVLQEMGFVYVDTICWEKPGEIGMRGAFMEKGIYYPNFAWEPILIYRKPPLVTVTGKAITDEDFPKFEFGDTPYITSVLRTNVWKVQPEKGSWHPAPYPMELAENLIRCYSKRGQIVLDPFGGSGTTAIAADKLGRRYFVIERSQEYYTKAKERINAQTLSLGL